MKTLVGLRDPVKNTAKESAKESAILQPTPLTDTILHPSTHNQLGSFPASSGLPRRTLTPRYMSPTIASMSQASAASTSQTEVRNTTPTQGLAPLKAAKSRNWLDTAMSLSGIGRPSDGAPHGKKDRVMSHSSDGIKNRWPSEANQFGMTSLGGLQRIEGSPRPEFNKSLPTEKALPSPPIEQTYTAGTPITQRGPLAANDLSLRRSSLDKDGGLGETEERPLLLPQGAARSDTNHILTEEDDLSADSPCVGIKLHRGKQPKASTRAVDISLPQASTTTRTASKGNSNRKAAISSTAMQLRRKPVPRPTQQTFQRTSNPLCETFPGAAAFQKFNRGTTQLSNSGRARASSLRANISTDGPSADLGAKDIEFTTGNLADMKPLSGISGNTSRPTSHIRTMDKSSRLPTKSTARNGNTAGYSSGLQSVRSVSQSPPPSQVIRQGHLRDVTRTVQAKEKSMNGQQKENMTSKHDTKARNEPHRGGMTSHAQREPNISDTVHTRDNSSTSSLDVNVGTSPVDGQQRQPMRSTSPSNPGPKPFKKNAALIAEASTSSGYHPSSIPIFRKETPLDYSRKSDTEALISRKYTKTAPGGFAIFEDEQLSGDADVNTDGMASPEGATPANTETSTAIGACTPCDPHGPEREAKTPPRNIPRLGPVLRISSTADSIIMGRMNPGNKSPNSEQRVSPALHRNAVISDLRKSSKRLDKYFARELDRQTAAVSRRASSKQSVLRPKSAGCDLKRICGLTAVRDQKSWSADVAKLILKQEGTTEGAVVVASMGVSQNDDPFTEFQQALMRKDGGTVKRREGVVLRRDHEDPKPTSGHVGTNSEPVQSTATAKPLIETTGAEASVSPSRAGTPATAPHISPRSRTLQVRVGGSPGKTDTRSASLVGTKLSSNRLRGLSVAHRPQLTTVQRTPASAHSTSGVRPPRSSSRVVVPDYTIRPSPVIESASKENIASPPPSKDFIRVTNQLGSSRGVGSTPLAIPDSKDIGASSLLAHKRVVDGKRLSDASKISQTPSAKMLAMSKIRGLFRKNTSPVDKSSSLKKGTKLTVTDEGSPLVSPVSSGATSRKPETRLGQDSGPSGSGSPVRPTNLASASFPTPGPTPARPSEVAETNALAMSLLNSARYESDSPKKERLLALGKAMVDSITNARDAEKAMEEAKIAASNAEMYYVMARKSVLDVTNMVREWKEVEIPSSLA
ncbi:hypothetical protein GP486_003185 [Trichoglossum hirsutum]|uniref:Uncharacterized protein n=1 Tax=Trichoglossum hirsutum TaxID=265104 RepID=A0A9P8RR11_9PEZI|nr:hypothetical protein GP486_003185 [Trichoglossum hirsutum]